LSNGETVELSTLTNREDRLRAQGIGPVYDGPSFLNKQQEFIKLLNAERRNLGLSEIPAPKE